jgi:carbon-monoxide dehydrogenase large subunit
MSRDGANLSSLDLPASYIGRSVARPNALRLLAGRGTYVDDVKTSRILHVAFVRSPYAHAKIRAIDVSRARAMEGVVCVAAAEDLKPFCTPWVGVLSHFAGLRSQPQGPLAEGVSYWQGEPVVAVVATSRSLAEDGLSEIDVTFEELEPTVDMDAALAPDAAPIHPALGNNIAFERRIDVGAVDAGFAEAAVVVERDFSFARHTGVSLEPRSILAEFNPADRQLVIHHSSQAPQMMARIASKHFNLPEHDVRVICKDVGGSFGVKIHIYPDEMAAIALSIKLGRAVKFVADRLESFVSDIHAREHRVRGRIGLSKDGDIVALEIDDRTGIGPYSMYPRTSAVEANQVMNITGGPYRIANYRARARVAFQNKVPTSQYRAVGHPIACAVTEGLLEAAGRKLGLDPFALRARNVIADDSYPTVNAIGLKFEGLSHETCLSKLKTLMNYDELRRLQTRKRAEGAHLGVGIGVFIEITSPGPEFYGVGGAPISAQDGCSVRLDPGGNVVCHTGTTEQGQGTDTIIAQVVASAVGVSLDRVRVISGDTQAAPYGGGTWASRGAGIGGEAAYQAGFKLKDGILRLAGIFLQSDPDKLDVEDNAVVDRVSREPRIVLSELSRIAHFRQDELPKGVSPDLVATHHYTPRNYPFAFTNGVQGSLVEVDVETGFVKLLKHWVVEDCGTPINPLLIEEQVRGGVVQGLGGALYEECLYDERGQLMNGSLAGYLLPMAGEMPDIEIDHAVTPTREGALGAKGAGEAGVAAAPAAVMNAINDALAPFGAEIATMPMTPERILRALGKIN